MNRVATNLLAALLALTAVTWMASPAHSDPPAGGGTRLVAASLSVDKADLTGADLATMTVAVHLSDPNGIAPADMQLTDVNGMRCPCVSLGIADSEGLYSPATTQADDSRLLSLLLTSGTATDGTWSASTTVGAANAGHWALNWIAAGSLKSGPGYGSDFGPYPVDGDSLGAAVDIAGSNWPVMRVDALHAPVAITTAYPARGYAYFSDSGQPAADLTLDISTTACPFNYSATYDHRVQTDSSGHWHTAWPAPIYDPFAACDGISASFGETVVGTVANTVSGGSRYAATELVSAYWTVRLSSASRRAPTTVRGSVPVNTFGVAVTLQRKVGNSWHPAANVTLGSGSRAFSFAISSSGTYRAVAGHSSFTAAGASAPVTVT
jgi:hypothetical protein